MEIKIKYKNDTPPFEVSIPTNEGLGQSVIELRVEGTSGRSRKVALNDYVINLTNAFIEIINKHETDIAELEIKDCLLGSIHKKEDYIQFMDRNGEKSLNAKFDLILFNIYKSFINEKLYFTRNADILRRGSLMYEGNTVNSNIIDRALTQDLKFVHSLVAAITTHLTDYDIKFNRETKKMEYTYKGTVLRTIEEIKQDDIFVFFKLVEVLLSRGPHAGIFFLDCEFLSADVVNALVAFINLYYRHNRLVFLYNIPSGKISHLKDLPRKIIELPNHKIPQKVKK